MYINIFIYHYKIWLSFREQQEKISTLTFSICRLAFRTDQTAVDKAYTVHTRSILNTYYWYIQHYLQTCIALILAEMDNNHWCTTWHHQSTESVNLLPTKRLEASSQMPPESHLISGYISRKQTNSHINFDWLQHGDMLKIIHSRRDSWKQLHSSLRHGHNDDDDEPLSVWLSFINLHLLLTTIVT